MKHSNKTTFRGRLLKIVIVVRAKLKNWFLSCCPSGAGDWLCSCRHIIDVNVVTIIIIIAIITVILAPQPSSSTACSSHSLTELTSLHKTQAVFSTIYHSFFLSQWLQFSVTVSRGHTQVSASASAPITQHKKTNRCQFLFKYWTARVLQPACQPGLVTIACGINQDNSKLFHTTVHFQWVSAQTSRQLVDYCKSLIN